MTTAGDWEIHDSGRFGLFGDIGPSICAVTREGCQTLFELAGPKDVNECKANCQLVIAAPKMMAACRSLQAAVANLRSLIHDGFARPMTREMEMAVDDINRALKLAQGDQS